MSWRRVLLVAISTCLIVGAPARPDDAPPSAEALHRNETAARAKAALELAALAKFCSQRSACDDSRQAWAKAIELDPQNADLPKELGKMKNRKGTPQAGTAAQLEERRAKAMA